MAADNAVKIGPRPVPQEPMVSVFFSTWICLKLFAYAQYIIVNLGMSNNFVTVDLANLQFPAVMRVDFIRVYQRSDSKNIGCDPPDFPTEAYIQQ